MKFTFDIDNIEEQPCMFKCTRHRLEYDKAVAAGADSLAREIDKQIMRDILGGALENDNPGPDVLIVGEDELPEE